VRQGELERYRRVDPLRIAAAQLDPTISAAARESAARRVASRALRSDE